MGQGQPGRLTSAIAEAKTAPQRLVLNRWEYVDGPPTGTETAPEGRAVVEIDPHGNRSTRYLDGFGATFATATPDGGIATMHRDAQGRVTHSRDIDGVETQYEFDSFGRVVEEFVALPESSSGYCTAQNAGPDGFCRIGLENSYDGAGRLTKSVDADGVSRTYFYTASGDLALEKQGEWLMSAYRYDDRGNADLVWEDGVVASFTHDDLDRIIQECRGARSDRCGQSLEYTYTDADRIETVTVGGSSTTSYQYDALGRVVSLTNPDKTERTMKYGAVTPMCSLTDEDGITTGWAHDPFGRLSETRLPGRSEPRRYDYAFRVDGRPFGLTTRLAEVVVTESDGGAWTTWYDFARRPVGQRRPDGTMLHYAYDGAQLRNAKLLDPTQRPLEVIAFGYDALGRRAWEWGPVSPETYDVRGGTPNEGDYVQHVAYTPAGRVRRSDGPIDPATSEPLSSSLYTYGSDGLLSRADRVGVTAWRYAYDEARRFPRLVEVAAGIKAAELRRTRYAYDPSGLYLQRMSTTGPGSGGPTAARQTLATLFDDFDDFGTPRSIETVDATEKPRVVSSYDLTTDINGRVAKVAVALEGVPLGLATFDYFQNGQIDRALADWAGGLDYERLADGRVSSVRGLDKLGSRLATIVRFSEWNPLGKPVAAELADGAASSSTTIPWGGWSSSGFPARTARFAGSSAPTTNEASCAASVRYRTTKPSRTSSTIPRRGGSSVRSGWSMARRYRPSTTPTTPQAIASSGGTATARSIGSVTALPYREGRPDLFCSVCNKKTAGSTWNGTSMAGWCAIIAASPWSAMLKARSTSSGMRPAVCS